MLFLCSGSPQWDWPRMGISELLRWPRISTITTISADIKESGLRKEGAGEEKSRSRVKGERKNPSVRSLAARSSLPFAVH